MQKFFLVFLCVFCGFIYSDSDFILETKKIEIPGFPNAYNASMVPYEGGYLLAYRNDIFDLPLKSSKIFRQYIGLVLLDSNLKVISKPRIFLGLGSRSYDPRLCWIGKSLYLVFASARKEDKNSVTSSILKLTKLVPENGSFYFEKPIELTAPNQNKWEKNWVLFDYKDEPLLSYSIDPHFVLQPINSSGQCKFLCRNKAVANWDYGIIRGGTPAQLVDGDYLAFFHSSKRCEDAYRYFIGAYKFSSNFPFELKEISVEPFTYSDFYTTKRNGLTPFDVVFPGSFVIEGDTIKVCYGENDASIKVMTIDKKKLYESMIKVNKKY